MAEIAVLDEALRIDDSSPVRHPGSGFLSAGPKMAGSMLSAVVNLPDADGAVSPARAAAPAEEARQRLDTVTAAAFPGIGLRFRHIDRLREG